jgi:RNA polymerase sigma factor (sigma-70 family)
MSETISFRTRRKTVTGFGLDHYGKFYPSRKSLPKEIEKDLFRRYRDGECELESQLVLQYAWMGVLAAHRFAERANYDGKDFDALVSAALEGVLRGVRRVDPERPNVASTYIMFWIRHYLRKEASGHRFIKATPSDQQLVLAAGKLRGEAQSVGIYLTPDEIAEELGTTVAVLEETTKRYNGTATWSLDALSSGKYARSPFEHLPMEEVGEAPALLSERRERIDEALSDLSERERTIVRCRFGLHNEPESTLQDLGTRFNISRERVRQIEARALQKIKRKVKGLLE